jgi:hypothetical protein
VAVWRAGIVLLSAAGCGTNEIMREAGLAKTCRLALAGTLHAGGHGGLLHDKTHPTRIPPLAPTVIESVVALTQADPPGELSRMQWTSLPAQSSPSTVLKNRVLDTLSQIA